ncbi:MAG: protein kinase [Phycisphaerales bacterium]|nr:protein kinase [Phycisphaerales bacterium]
MPEGYRNEPVTVSIPGYQILERIGTGGQGYVFRAVQESTKREVALKVFMAPLAPDSKARLRFERETKLLSLLDYPNIVRIYDGGCADDTPWYSMELIEGRDLIKFADICEMNNEQRIALFAKVAKAMGCVHDLGIVHRDLKPANILVDLDGSPHIVDFGFARDAIGEKSSSVSEAVGTLAFSSPEQIRSEKLDVRSDVYSLGVILYLLLSGRFPYSVEGSRLETMKHILNSEPARLSAIPKDLWWIVTRALEKDKERRYPNAEEFSRDLDRWRLGEVVRAKSPSHWYVLSKSIRRNKLATILTSAGLLISVASGFAVLENHNRKQISRLAQVGLDSSALFHLGSLERDAKRRGRAVELFKRAIEVIDRSSVNDPGILGIRYRALHHLAWDSYVNNDIEAGRAYADIAVESAESMSEKYPADLRWQRHLAFSYVLRGRGFVTNNDWRAAHGRFKRAHDIIAGLLEKEPNNTSCRTDLPFCMRWLARCHHELGDTEAAKSLYVQSKAISEDLHRLEPELAEHVVDIAMCDYRIARCIASSKRYEEAKAIIMAAMKSLTDLQEPHGMDGPVRDLMENLERYLQYLERKTA